MRGSRTDSVVIDAGVVPVLTAAEAAAWDTRAREDAAIPSRVLMEAAGRAAAQVIAREFAAVLDQGVLLAAGFGNNGGDGWVVARVLRAMGIRVSACETAKDRSRDCEANRRLALADGVALLDAGASWPAAGLVIDALLGTGAGGPPRDPLASLARAIAEHAAPVAAIDGPTGLDLTSGEAHGPVRAALTVTFGGFRRGHLLQREWVGRVVAVDIGFPPADPSWPMLVTDRWAGGVLPRMGAAMHKGDRGRILVIGGDRGMAGAAMHVARSAFACGAGLVKLALSEPSVRAAQTNFPDALTVPTVLGPGLEPELEEAVAWADAIVLGPGLGRGRGDDRSAFAAAVLDRASAPLVIDADAFHALQGKLALGTAPRVLTPHPGEFATAFPDLADLGRDDRFAAPAEALASLMAGSATAALLLKGVPTVIAEPRGVRVVAAGNPSLATGGSGDLLAGCIAAFLVRGLGLGDAAALGAQALGRAAEIASARHTVRASRPEDVSAAFPVLWREWNNLPAPEPPSLAVLDLPAVD